VGKALRLSQVDVEKVGFFQGVGDVFNSDAPNCCGGQNGILGTNRVPHRRYSRATRYPSIPEAKESEGSNDKSNRSIHGSNSWCKERERAGNRIRALTKAVYRLSGHKDL
jgi:hypothetical protein